MIKSTIRTYDTIPHLTARLREQTVAALDAAAEAGKEVADERGQGIHDATFTIVPAHDFGERIIAGVLAKSPLYRIFDKGSLGKRTAALKRPNLRKEKWPVNRRGAAYEAHRGDITGKGVSARQITNPARTAGRRALLERIRNLA
jgi:hypothetical protein